MKSASYTYFYTRGDDVRITIRVRENVYDPVTQTYTPGDYIDLTGWTGASEWRPDPDSTTLETAVVTMDPDQVTHKGQFTVELTDIQGRNIEDGWGFDIELDDPSGFKQTYIKGTVKMDLDYTHD